MKFHSLTFSRQNAQQSFYYESVVNVLLSITLHTDNGTYKCEPFCGMLHTSAVFPPVGN